MSARVKYKDISPTELDGLLYRINGTVPADDFAIVERIVETFRIVTNALRKKETTIWSLRKLLGLRVQEKIVDVAPPGAAETVEPAREEAGGMLTKNQHEPGGPGGAPEGEKVEKKVKGHGRIPSSAFPNAVHIPVPHETLRVGDCCPGCSHGKLYPFEKPAEFLRVFGQPPLIARSWDCERMRCNGCGTVYTARAPKEACGDKYDATAVSMIALMRYGTGMPHERLQQLQKNLQTPLPASTQWEVLEERVDLFQMVFGELIRQAAQGFLFHIDDTFVRILEWSGKRRALRLAKGQLENPERTGLHTTGIVAMTADGHTIALVLSGRKHAGENLSDILELRNKTLPPPCLMCDALACNTPKDKDVIEGNCLSHAHRKFADELENFPVEAASILSQIASVFAIDDECHTKKLTKEERLEVHQQKSTPVMDALKKEMQTLFDEKLVEPNSGLGSAINYMLKRWDKFTLFLRLAGAPIDNNIVERLLKMAIRHRNNSLFFLTQRGADVANVYMSLIYTTQLCGENAFEYLTAIQRHEREVAGNPAAWLPWNWRDAIHSATQSPPLQRAA